MAQRTARDGVTDSLSRSVRRRRRLVRAMVAAILTAWPLVLAQPTSGASCLYEGGSVSIRAGDETVIVEQGVAGTILVNGQDCSPAAPVADTVAISMSGGTIVEIAMVDTTGATIDWGAINWTLSLGFSIPADLVIENADGDAGIRVTVGASGIDLNTDGNLDVTYSRVGVLRVVGGPPADTLSGAGSTATGAPTPTALELFGGSGDDRLSGGAEDDSLGCGEGVDWIDFSAAAAAVTVDLASGTATGQGLDAVAECENIAGSALADTLTGDAGANRIAPGLGDDTVDGGEGIDVVGYDDAPAAVVVDLGANGVTGGSGTDALAGIEGATGSAFADTIIGSDLGNRLVGGAGPDTVLGLAGDDTLDGGSEIDRVIGGDGTDLCVLDGVERSCEPSLRVEPSPIAPGDPLTVQGGGWYRENGPVEIRLLSDQADPRVLATLDPTDAWGIDGSVPAPEGEGTYRVEACQPCTDLTSEFRSREVVVQPGTVGPTGPLGPTIELSQTEAGPGDRVRVRGSGWDPDGGRVRIFLEPSTSSEPAIRARAQGPNGTFDEPLDIPEELEPGTYTVRACQPCGPAPVQRTATLTIPGPARWWIPVALVLAAAAVAALIVRLMRKPPISPPGPIGSRLALGEPEVVVEPAGNGPPRHSVRLIPAPTPGSSAWRKGARHERGRRHGPDDPRGPDPGAGRRAAPGRAPTGRDHERRRRPARPRASRAARPRARRGDDRGAPGDRRAARRRAGRRLAQVGRVG
ncbi:MAG: hypothetical protein ACRDHU_09565, partial [Actinomycetota bacterium]